MLKKMFLLIFFPFMTTLFALDATSCSLYTISEAPIWVDLFDYNLNLTPSNENIKHGYMMVLVDKQENWEEKCLFMRKAFKITSKKGARDNNDFWIELDPAVEQLSIHSIRVYRHEMWYDFMPNTQVKTEDYDSPYIDLIFRISNLEPGDICEVQYTKRNQSTFLKRYINKDLDLRYSNNNFLLSYRLIASPTHHVLIKGDEEGLIKIQDLSEQFREWSIQYIPSSLKKENQKLILSEYPSWKSVVQELLPLLQASIDFTNNPSKEALELVDGWMQQSADPFERARLAVRFVQNEFSGFLRPVDKYQYKDLNEVLDFRNSQLFGKVLLLHGLLKLMNISSTPFLTGSFSEKIDENLPGHVCIDYAILRIEFDGTSIFVDPNMDKQVGPLESNLLSSMGKRIALPLCEDTVGLVAIRNEQYIYINSSDMRGQGSR